MKKKTVIAFTGDKDYISNGGAALVRGNRGLEIHLFPHGNGGSGPVERLKVDLDGARYVLREQILSNDRQVRKLSSGYDVSQSSIRSQINRALKNDEELMKAVWEYSRVIGNYVFEPQDETISEAEANTYP